MRFVTLLGLLSVLVFLHPSAASDPVEGDLKGIKRFKLTPKKVGSKGNGQFTIVQALDLISAETGNVVDVSVLGGLPEDQRKLSLKGKTFWQSIEMVENAWRLDRRQLRPAWSRGASLTARKGKVYFESIFDGVRVTVWVSEPLKSKEDELSEVSQILVELEAEPRLPLHAVVDGEFKGHHGNGVQSLGIGRPFSHERAGNTLRVSYFFQGTQPKRLELQMVLRWYGDWRFKRFKPLNDWREYRDQRLEKLEFQEGTVTEGEKDGKRWVRVRIIEKTALLGFHDFSLRLPGGKKLEPIPAYSWAADAYFPDVPKDVPLSKMKLFLRVPNSAKSSVIEIDHTPSK